MGDRERQGQPDHDQNADQSEVTAQTPAQSPIQAALMRRKIHRLIQRKAEASAVAPGAATPLNSGAGSPLPANVRERMEPALGADLSGVKIHTDGHSADAASRLGAHAFTVGTDVHFASGQFAPGTRQGDHLIAHELAHTVQQQKAGIQRKAAEGAETTGSAGGLDVSHPSDPSERQADAAAEAAVSQIHDGQRQGPPAISAAPSPMIHRFASTEHRDLGDKASGNAQLDMKLDDGSAVSFGEMVALAGDYFESYDQIKQLMATKDGQLELRWVRWKALGVGAEPPAPDDMKKRAMDRYLTLAANNISHFGAGGTAKDTYQKNHIQALRDAYVGGATKNTALFDQAMEEEAFSEHFLSDRFAGGHVRTPRKSIKDWYQAAFPDSVGQFVAFAANWIAENLDKRGDTPWYWPNSSVASKVAVKIRALGGKAVDSFSLGDIVSLAYHNHDNEGLKVVSDADASGKAVAGGYHWESKGDNNLASSPDTQQMAVAAMKASIQEINDARAAGQAGGAGPGGAAALNQSAQTYIAAMPGFAAEKFVPREDPTADNAKMNWTWGSLDPVLRQAVDQAVKGEIVSTLREKEGSVAVEMHLSHFGDEEPDGAVVLHVQAAFIAFVDYLAANGIQAIEQAMQEKATIDPEDIPRDAGVPGGVPDQDAGPPGAADASE